MDEVHQTIVEAIAKELHGEATSAFINDDVFTKIREEGLDGPDGSLIACVCDLRRYLLLVEAEMTE